MDKFKMRSRLREMTEEQISKALRLIREGYGTAGIRFETGLTIKQVNAVAELSKDVHEASYEFGDKANPIHY